MAAVAGDINTPTSDVSASSYRVVSPGPAFDGSDDQLLGILTGIAEGDSSLLALIAGPSEGPSGSKLRPGDMVPRLALDAYDCLRGCVLGTISPSHAGNICRS